MMAIESQGLCSIETAELVDLGLNDVLEGAAQPRMKKYPSKAMPQQVRGELVLMFREPSGTIRRRKWGTKIEVETRVDSRFPRHGGGSVRILHENHGAH
jgi:hypothetical protein